MITGALALHMAAIHQNGALRHRHLVLHPTDVDVLEIVYVHYADYMEAVRVADPFPHEQSIRRVRSRVCAFCGKATGTGIAAFVISALEALGGKPGGGYAHIGCINAARLRPIQEDK